MLYMINKQKITSQVTALSTIAHFQSIDQSIKALQLYQEHKTTQYLTTEPKP